MEAKSMAYLALKVISEHCIGLVLIEDGQHVPTDS